VVREALLLFLVGEAEGEKNPREGGKVVQGGEIRA
jgi:hypothetical protein